MSRGYAPIALLLSLLASCGQPEPDPDPQPGGEPAQSVDPPRAGLVARPLPARPPIGGKLFTRLPGGQTGIDFVNPVDQSHPMKYLYASTMGCGGVAIGDFDDDGRPDLYFTGGPRANALYRQVGELEFEEVTAAAGVDGGGAWSTGAALVDFDNDGDLDIYVCNYDSPNLLYRNDGGGKFTESAAAAGLDFVGAGHTPAFCDFDLDGDLDLYLLTNYFYHPGGRVTGKISELRDGRPAILERYRKYYGISAVAQDPQSGGVTVSHDAVGDSDRFVRNDGDGTFTEITRPGQIVGKGNAAVWWDEDLDGWPDLYVANDFKDPDRLFHNKRDGGFGEIIRQRVPHTTWFSMGADSADLDGDARPDLMVADMSGTNHFKQKVGMGAMGENSDFLKTADPRQYMRNAVFLNPGGGRYLEAAYLAGLASSDWTWTVRLSDFDNDARVDVFLTNGMAVDLNVVDNPAAIEALPGETEWDKHVRAKTPQLKEQNLAFRNRGDLRFDDVSESWGLDHVGMSYAASAADLDRDGDLEIVVANLEEEVGIYQNHSAAGNCVLVELRGAKSNRRGIGATVRLESASGVQTRFLTLNRGYMAAGEAVLHFGLGEAEEISRLSVRWPGGGEQVFEGIRANQHLTITQDGGSPPPVDEVTPPLFQRVQSLAGAAHREVPFDDFGRQPLLPHKLSQLGPGIATGDIDGDGEDDVFLGGARGDVGKLIRHLGEGKMEAFPCPVFVEDRGYEDMGAIFFDSDADGDLDLYVVSGGVECQPGDPILQDRLYLNDGRGNFSKGAVMPACDSGSVVAASDFDSDGDLDLFVGGRVVPGSYPLAAESRLLRNSGGDFEDVTDQIAPGLRDAGMVTGALWSDVDNDGLCDLLVTYEWGPVRFFKNEGGRLADQTEAAGLAGLSGWWNGISGGDFDNDGDVDYAITNFGLNTKYKASPERPAFLYYGDFEGGGRMRLVEAEYEEEILYPVRGRSCSSEAMPFLLDKFDSYKGFAAASVEEIYSPENLEASIRFEAMELRSGILLNDGGGSFEFHPLPRIAQIAPGFGSSVCDFDSDGKLDLYIVQNFFHPQAETGRMAGGVSQLLRGSGDGRFSPIGPAESGLVVPGDAKSLAQVDLDSDGRLDFLVGINAAAPELFLNRSGAGQLTVKLIGNPGNPGGIGARVEVHPESGASRSAEVYAGSGYLSQSSAPLQFGGLSGPYLLKVRWGDGTISEIRGTEVAGLIEVRKGEGE